MLTPSYQLTIYKERAIEKRKNNLPKTKSNIGEALKVLDA